MRIAKSVHLALCGVSFLFLACGGGGGGDETSNGTLRDVVGHWDGVVVLSSNGCERDIPVETIDFHHSVVGTIGNSQFATVTLSDEGVDCFDLQASSDTGEFFAVCPNNSLPGFSPDLNCFEQVVWRYQYSGATNGVRFSDVTRTAYVHCSNEDDTVGFACPVEYRGSASSGNGIARILDK
jgi:hypothetical protein